MRNPGRIAAACLAIVLMGCSGGGTPTPVPSPAVTTAHIDVGGLTRDYLVATPPDIASRDSLPLLLALHGATQTMNDAETIGGFDDIAVDPGAVVVYPNGYEKTWNAGGCCAPATTDGIDDVGFLTALLDRLEADYPIDPDRVFLLGASNGGEMAYRTACELSDRIAAVAGVITTLLVDCNPTTPVSVIDIHGTADLRIPLQRRNRAVQRHLPVRSRHDGALAPGRRLHR